MSLSPEERMLADAVGGCVDDLIVTLNRHPHPAVQTVALSTVLARIWATKYADMSMVDEMEQQFHHFADQTLDYWKGFINGDFDPDVRLN